MRSFKVLSILSLSAVLALASCGGDDDHAAPAASGGAPGAQPHSDTKLTGRKGNYFEPQHITVKEGDVVRFKLVTGVHNVHFVADSNKFAKWLPPMSTFLQLPGQTFDVPMTFDEGRFYYQCDPHALLGMVGSITVEDDN
jgi:plastocyanin